MRKRPKPGTRIEHDDGVNPVRTGTVEESGDLSTLFAYATDDGTRYLCGDQDPGWREVDKTG